MKKIKAIFFDLDGTLVSFATHRIPQSALEAIHRVRQSGVKVFVATGRPQPLIDNLGDLEYDGILSASGACFTSSDGELVYQRQVDRGDVARMVAYQAEHDVPVVYATCRELFVAGKNDVAARMFDNHNIHPHPVERPAAHALTLDVVAMIAYFPESDQQRIMSQVLTHCDAYRWHPDFADCIAAGCSKATGIDAVIARYGISLAETMAVGDGGNDIPMIQHAGVGVAMGNASATVKAAADIVTTHIDHDGVARLLATIMQGADF